MNIFDLYKDKKHQDIESILNLGAQQHPNSLPANFLEKDVWVTEILRLLYDEGLLGNTAVAFKGGTALSKCWQAIDRFSEDIDLSIHWSDLANPDNELDEWEKTTKSSNQQSKFRTEQSARLMEWTEDFTARLNERLSAMAIDDLKAEIEPGSGGEKIDIHFPRIVNNADNYQLDHVLLEFGARNRGKPTQQIPISTYLGEIKSLKSLNFPKAKVNALEVGYILWEKITALHQFSTQTKEPKFQRLARHWYDTDMLLQKAISNPLNESQAMQDVIEMKKHRWAQPGVDYTAILKGKLQLVPNEERLKSIEEDHQAAITGGMFFNTPDTFKEIIDRLRNTENIINKALQHK